MNYIAYNKECRLVMNSIFDDNYEIRAEYKDGNDWAYIAAPSFYSSALDTKEKTYEYYQTALVEINTAMEELFGKDEAPESGVARIQWLMDNRTTVENDKLKLN